MAQTRDPIPERFDSLEEIQDFWDRRSTADYWDEMEEVDMELLPALKWKIELKKLFRSQRDMRQT